MTTTTTDTNQNSVGYIDGFVIPVPKQKIDQYREQATIASQVWKEYGALDYLETVGDDVNSEFGIPFPKLAATSDDEVVIFAYISYRDRAHRDEVNAKVMKDERITAMCPDRNPGFEPSFDPQRMTYGGFSVLVGN